MTQEVSDNRLHAEVLQMTTQVVSAYVGHNRVDKDQIPEVIKSIHDSLSGLNEHTELATKTTQKPAVPIKKSVTEDYLICLEDGKKFKMIKRHLRTSYGLSPDEYRVKWGLAWDYPMVAPNYAKVRSALAKQNGLGKRTA